MFDLYFILFFDSFYGSRKIKRLSSGGTDFGESLDASSATRGRNLSEIIGARDKSLEGIDVFIDTKALLKNKFPWVEDSEITDITGTLVNYGYSLLNIEAATKDLEPFFHDEQARWKAFSGIATGNFEVLQELLGNRFSEFVRGVGKPDKE